MISNEIPLSHSTAEWQYGRFGVDVYVQEGWKVLGDIVGFTDFFCVEGSNVVCLYRVFEIQCKTLWANSFRNWNYFQNATEQKCDLCYDGFVFFFGGGEGEERTTLFSHLSSVVYLSF